MLIQRGKYLFVIKAITTFSLIIPQIVFALPGTGLFDAFMKKFQAIAPFIESISDLFYIIFLVYAVSFLLFLTTTVLLQWVINQQTAWLTLEGNAMVEAGFAFTSGLANMFLILIFIACAFAIILKIEKFEVKKILPALIIVALLLNFSLVFIGMIIDVSTILFNTILGDNQDFVILAMNSLIGGGQGLLQNFIAFLSSMAITSAVPFVGPTAQLGTILGFGAFFLPNLLIWILQIIAMSLMAFILFFYVLLFVSRVLIIQILAIFAPLAFLCFILPNTKKFFDEWLKALIGWIFLGIFVLFLLMIGLGVGQQIMPGDMAPNPIPGMAWFQIGEIFIYYFFLFVFLAIVLYISKKYMPVGADSVAKGIGDISKIAAGTGIGVLGAKMIARGAVGRAVNLEEKAKEIKGKQADTPGYKLSIKERATLKASQLSNWGYRMSGTTATKQEVKMAEEDAKIWANIPTEELNKKNLSEQSEQQVARAIALKDRGEIHLIKPEDMIEVIRTGESSLIKAMAPHYLKEMGESFEIQRKKLEERRVQAETSGDQKELQKTKEESVKINIAESIVQKLSKKKTLEEGGGATPEEEEIRRRKEAVLKVFPTDPKKIENIPPTEDLIRTMIDFGVPSNLMAQYARIHGTAFAENFKKVINNMKDPKGNRIDGPEKIANELLKKRPDLVKYAMSSSGGSIIALPQEILNELEKKQASKKNKKEQTFESGEGI